MSDKDNYAPGTFNDPNAPWTEPEPIEDTDAFQDAKVEMWDERLSDPEYMLEALGEQCDDDLKHLARLIKGNITGIHTSVIGAYVSKWVCAYCEPSDDEVIEELGLAFKVFRNAKNNAQKWEK